MSENGTPKKFMFVNRTAPYGTVYALESLEVVLISAAFDQDVSLVFIDDGVFQLKKGQQTKGDRDQELFADLSRARRLRRREALRRAASRSPRAAWPRTISSST